MSSNRNSYVRTRRGREEAPLILRSPIDKYLDSAKCEPMTLAEEREACDNWPATRDLFISTYMRLAMQMAWHFRTANTDINDLRSAALLGLSEAATRFNPDKGRFGTYAHWYIKMRLNRELKSHSLRAAHYPMNVYRDYYSYIRRARKELESNMNGEVGSEELYDFLRRNPDDFGGGDTWTRHRFEAAILLDRGDCSLDDQMPHNAAGEMMPMTCMDTVPGDNTDPAIEIDHDSAKATIAEALSSLPAREARILWLTFGQGMTLKEVGLKMDLSRERVRQIRAVATGKITKGERGRALRKCLESLKGTAKGE
jgi:RNA polymerase sigma factor (sigma-70 family)